MLADARKLRISGLPPFCHSHATTKCVSRIFGRQPKSRVTTGGRAYGGAVVAEAGETEMTIMLCYMEFDARYNGAILHSMQYN